MWIILHLSIICTFKCTLRYSFSISKIYKKKIQHPQYEVGLAWFFREKQEMVLHILRMQNVLLAHLQNSNAEKMKIPYIQSKVRFQFHVEGYLPMKQINILHILIKFFIRLMSQSIISNLENQLSFLNIRDLHLFY